MSAFDPTTGPSAVATAAALARGETTSSELTDFALARLRDGHAVCNSVITFEDDEARTLAERADAARRDGNAEGPLAGVPLAHKDMFDRRDKTASWGGNIQADKPADANATVIERLERAGTFQIAALHLTEFAFGASGHNFVRGHGRNPFNPDHISGGSSS
ncbi:MAG: amidase family protein, partial [Pseudomonadota bacterium]